MSEPVDYGELVERLRAIDAAMKADQPIRHMKDIFGKAADAIASMQGEVGRHLQHKRDAYEAVKEALSLCQHTPDEWLAMSPELAAFKREMFGTLEMRCLNLGYGVRGALSQHPGEGA